jgi:hypothetical protein
MKFSEKFEVKKTLFLTILLALLGTAEAVGQSFEDLVSKAKGIELELAAKIKKEGKKIMTGDNSSIPAFEMGVNGKKIRMVFENGEERDPTTFYGMVDGKMCFDGNGDGKIDKMLINESGDNSDESFKKSIVTINTENVEELKITGEMSNSMSSGGFTFFSFGDKTFIYKSGSEILKPGNEQESEDANQRGQAVFNKFLENI